MRGTFRLACAGFALLLLLAAPASGAVAPGAPQIAPPSIAAASLPCACGPGERAALLSWRERIATAPSLEAARDLATAQTRLAQRALRGARWLAPGSDAIANAHARLSDYEKRVDGAETPEAVAAEFGELVQVASYHNNLMADVDIDVDGDGGCEFSGGEIIAIVLGFILGIIPGIILLILLC